MTEGTAKKELKAKICLTCSWWKEYNCLLRNLSDNLFLTFIWDFDLYSAWYKKLRKWFNLIWSQVGGDPMLMEKMKYNIY